MKIIYIASKYDYMDASRGYGFEHYNFYGTLKHMKNIELIYFSHEKILDIGKDKFNEGIIELVKKEKPDLLFAAMVTDQLKKETIDYISKKTNCETFAWFCDDCWRFYNYSKDLAPHFNWASSTDILSPINYKKIGYKNLIKTQFACNHFLYKPLALPKIYDVTFVGLPHGDRRKIVEQIKKVGIKVECWGKGWPNGRATQDDMIRIFSQSKININFAKGSGSINLLGLARIFFKKENDSSIRLQNPKFWVGNVKSLLANIKNHIKGRNFEIPGCGGFLLTGDAEGLADYYEDGKEIVTYKNPKDLIRKIKYYLAHNEEREAIAKAGYERTLRCHTYEKRFEEIFKIIDPIK